MKNRHITQEAFFWTLESVCALHRKPYNARLARQQLAAPYDTDALIRAVGAFGLDGVSRRCKAAALSRHVLPLIAWMRPQDGDTSVPAEGDLGGSVDFAPALVLQADNGKVLLIAPGEREPQTLTLAAFASRYLGYCTGVTRQTEAAADPDSIAGAGLARRFGFSWFVPELLKHKRLWQEVLLASLVIQLVALATPLFTQTIIDKVVVHRTQSTLIVIMIAMAMFMLFSAGLTWLRQYLVLHTGNRVDAVLGVAVFERMFRLPPMYFQQRPTGVIAARLQGIESIREFIAGAAVTLVLDLPFLLIFIAIMFYYSVTLTLIVLAILTVIVALSAAVAPLFQRRLQEQFLLGARNQAFIMEYLVGVETVKSLQLEPQLNTRYSGYLASHLQAGFATRQLANSYNTTAQLLDQLMSLLILGIGAYTVMQSREFTIGMLVAFQMFAARVSQPMLRLVGLWQQFQQARLSVARLGDLMNAPAETYSLIPARTARTRGAIALEDVAFRYAHEQPLVYENLSLTISPGQMIGIMGPSGSGKSTLAKLLQGFYQPVAGRILLDGIDIRHLSANELRAHFGVVPQETVLFSGSIHDNLQMACPEAGFDEIVAACRVAEIHHVIEALPQGYQTLIGERGSGLSGGQRQRIAIARAILKRPGVLVFDEATSALDAATAEQFARTINGLRGKVTMLFISHGLPRGLVVDAVYRLGAHGAQLLPQGGAASAAARSAGIATMGQVTEQAG